MGQKGFNMYKNKQRKKELEFEQKEAHKEHANEKVKCPFCQAEFTQTNLARNTCRTTRDSTLINGLYLCYSDLFICNLKYRYAAAE